MYNLGLDNFKNIKYFTMKSNEYNLLNAYFLSLIACSLKLNVNE